MADNKLTWVELRKAVAQTTNLPEQEVGVFLNALLEAILVGLKEDKQVKIKGIGTFSLKAVAPRKSVNIATGENFTIEGYNKLTFSAEAMLKESIEKRRETPTTKDLIADINQDPLRKLGAQATEIVDILAELGQAPTASNEDDLTPQPVETKTQEQPVEEEQHEIEKPLATEEKPTQAPVEEKISTEDFIIPPTQPTRKCHKWICWTLGVIALVCIAAVGYYYRSSIVALCNECQICRHTPQPTETPTAIVDTVVIDTTATPIIDPTKIDSIGNDTLSAESDKEQCEEKKCTKPRHKKTKQASLSLADQPRKYKKIKCIERVGKDSRLTWIAKKHYGHKELWVFIYEANKKKISNPEQIRQGQQLRIPKLDKKWRDMSNPELQQLVDSLANEYLNK